MELLPARWSGDQFIRGGMDFCRAPALAFANGFRTAPLLPLAERPIDNSGYKPWLTACIPAGNPASGSPIAEHG